MGYKNNDPCWDNADDDEPIFVGLGRDAWAALMTQVWAAGSGDCQPAGQVDEAISHIQRMLDYCHARNPGRRAERIDADALDRAIGYLMVEASRVRKPRFGDMVVLRESAYFADGFAYEPAGTGPRVNDIRTSAVVTAVDGRFLTLAMESGERMSYVLRWQPARKVDEGYSDTQGWCWPHEVDDVPAVIDVAIPLAEALDG